MKTKEKPAVRLTAYLFGLFIMTMGIAISVKSDLGVSPVSSIPYTLTCVCGIEMGNATILLHCALVVLQIIMLRAGSNGSTSCRCRSGSYLENSRP